MFSSEHPKYRCHPSGWRKLPEASAIGSSHTLATGSFEENKVSCRPIRAGGARSYPPRDTQNEMPPDPQLKAHARES